MKKDRFDFPFDAEITVRVNILMDARDGSLISYVLVPKSVEAAVAEAVIEQSQNMNEDEDTGRDR